MKTCCRCKENKSPLDFNKKGKSKDGLQGYCRDCSHKAFSSYYNENKAYHLGQVKVQKANQAIVLRLYMKEYLLQHPCVDCGEDDWVVLEFDHVRGKKKKAVTLIASSSYSLDTLKKEIAKCEVRCCNCHRRRTLTNIGSYRVPPPRAHGEPTDF